MLLLLLVVVNGCILWILSTVIFISIVACALGKQTEIIMALGEAEGSGLKKLDHQERDSVIQIQYLQICHQIWPVGNSCLWSAGVFVISFNGKWGPTKPEDVALLGACPLSKFQLFCFYRFNVRALQSLCNYLATTPFNYTRSGNLFTESASTLIHWFFLSGNLYWTILNLFRFHNCNTDSNVVDM